MDGKKISFSASALKPVENVAAQNSGVLSTTVSVAAAPAFWWKNPHGSRDVFRPLRSPETRVNIEGEATIVWETFQSGLGVFLCV